MNRDQAVAIGLSHGLGLLLRLLMSVCAGAALEESKVLLGERVAWRGWWHWRLHYWESLLCGLICCCYSFLHDVLYLSW